MTKDKMREHLAALFVPRDEPLEGVCFAMEYLNSENVEAHSVQEAVSDVMHESDLSFDFAYAIAEKAVDILANIIDEGQWNDDDIDEAITIAADNAVPIYNGELMTIYQSDWWAVDEALAEMGGTETIGMAQAAWYMQIESMTQAIHAALLPLLDSDNAHV